MKKFRGIGLQHIKFCCIDSIICVQRWLSEQWKEINSPDTRPNMVDSGDMRDHLGQEGVQNQHEGSVHSFRNKGS